VLVAPRGSQAGPGGRPVAPELVEVLHQAVALERYGEALGEVETGIHRTNLQRACVRGELTARTQKAQYTSLMSRRVWEDEGWADLAKSTVVIAAVYGGSYVVYLFLHWLGM
jgi:hypothetical protein